MEYKITSHIKKGLIISLILVVLDLISGLAGFRLADWYRWIPTIVIIIAVIIACITYGKQLHNNTSFGNVFAHGFKTTAVIICIMVLYTLISIYIIFPETKGLALEMARKQMEEKGNLPQDAIEKGLEMTNRFFLPFAIAGAIFGTGFSGAIASLLGAAITKKNPQSPFENKIEA
jgi:hypothetical protein